MNLAYICGMFIFLFPPAHSLTQPLTSSHFSQDWKRWLNRAEERICSFPPTSTQPSGTPTSSSSPWVSSLCSVHIPHSGPLRLTSSTSCVFISSAGEHPDQDLRDGEGSRGWPEVHRGVRPADRRGVRWLQNRHREEHGAGAGRWEHQTDIWRQHQAQPQPAGLFSRTFNNSAVSLVFLVSEGIKTAFRFCPTQNSLRREQRCGISRSRTASWLVGMRPPKVKGRSELCVPFMNTGFLKHGSSPQTHGRLNSPNWWGIICSNVDGRTS